ncbi:MAG: hypothetical protein R2731_11150 [Nocardioides sp.]
MAVATMHSHRDPDRATTVALPDVLRLTGRTWAVLAVFADLARGGRSR